MTESSISSLATGPRRTSTTATKQPARG
jgi:hypothetical protein